MGRMRSGWAFLSEHGFSGSAGKSHVTSHLRGPHKISKPSGPEAHIKQRGPVKGSAPTAHHPKTPSHHPSTGAEHKYAKGGKVGRVVLSAKDVDASDGEKVKFGPTDRHGGVLNFKKGGKFGKEESERKLPHEHQAGWKPEDYEKHESQTGFQHEDVEEGEHMEAAKGGKVKFAKGGHTHEVECETGGPMEHARGGKHKMHKAKGGAVQGYNAGGDQDPETSHFMEHHTLHRHPHGIGPKPHHIGHGFHDKHHAHPHGTHGHEKFAKGGVAKKAVGGLNSRPPGMPRAPMLGMKRVRHGPMQRQQPGIPNMAPVGTSPLGMGAGTAPKVMKKGGKK